MGIQQVSGELWKKFLISHIIWLQFKYLKAFLWISLKITSKYKLQIINWYTEKTIKIKS